MPRRQISLKEFRARRGVSRTTDWRQRRHDPDYPVVRQISPGFFGVDEDAADAYIAARPVKRPPEPQAASEARRRQLAAGKQGHAVPHAPAPASPSSELDPADPIRR